MYGIFAYIYHKNEAHVGKYIYIPYMDPMGYLTTGKPPLKVDGAKETKRDGSHKFESLKVFGPNLERTAIWVIIQPTRVPG